MVQEATPKRIFISYRRSDTSGHAGRLYDYLKDYFGGERIFFDVDTIQPGTNFEQKINSELDNSEAVLVLIGNQWLESKDKEGNRRLDHSQDYVRFEVETALKKNIQVIPILLQGTPMPSPNELPDTLHDLSRRNAVRLNDDHWYSDCNLLAGILKNTLHVSRSLKERKIRRYRLLVFALFALVMFMIVLFQIFPDSSSLLYNLLILVLALAVAGNVALVTYLLGSIKKELDRLSWAIIIIAILGAIAVYWGWPFITWAPVMIILEAGLLDFVEPDE
jgi:hypothetical protein